MGQSYALNTPTLAIRTLPDGKRVPITIPKGAVLKITAGPLGDTRLVLVEWDRQMVTMFTIDLQERGSVNNEPRA